MILMPRFHCILSLFTLASFQACTNLFYWLFSCCFLWGKLFSRNLLMECLPYISFPVTRACIKRCLVFCLFLGCRTSWLILYTCDVTYADSNAQRKLQMWSVISKCAITDEALLLKTFLSYELCHNIWKTSFQWVHSPCMMMMMLEI